jgi:hypothetical protein
VQERSPTGRLLGVRFADQVTLNLVALLKVPLAIDPRFALLAGIAATSPTATVAGMAPGRGSRSHAYIAPAEIPTTTAKRTVARLVLVVRIRAASQLIRLFPARITIPFSIADHFGSTGRLSEAEVPPFPMGIPGDRV